VPQRIFVSRIYSVQACTTVFLENTALILVGETRAKGTAGQREPHRIDDFNDVTLRHKCASFRACAKCVGQKRKLVVISGSDNTDKVVILEYCNNNND